MTIDLHGLIETEAVGPISMALMALEDGSEDQVYIITGNGYVLKDLAIEMIEEANLQWSTEGSNYGSLIVTR